jgi:hypothetical protein
MTDMEELEKAAVELNDLYARADAVAEEISALIITTFPFQRHLICKWVQTEESVETIIQKLPVLEAPQWLLLHFQQLTGFSVKDRMAENFLEVSVEVVQFFINKLVAR